MKCLPIVDYLLSVCYFSFGSIAPNKPYKESEFLMPTQPTPKHGLSVVYSTDDALMRAAWYDPTEQQVRLDQVPVGTLIRINASPINGGRMHTWYLEKVVVDENDPEIFCRKAGEGAAKKFEGDGPYAVEDAWSFEEDETVQIIQISCLSP